MKVGVIQASSQKSKNELLYACTARAAKAQKHEVINFGVFNESQEQYSYIETAVAVSLLLVSHAVDFVVTGCSSGQGMMLACNSLPGVLCGYTPTPQDAFLYGRINNGNAVSLPLGLGFGWSGEINLQCILDKLFEGPFGVGYPAEEAKRKQQDTMLLKEINRQSKLKWPEIIDEMNQELIKQVLKRNSVYDYIMKYGRDEVLKRLMATHR